MTCQYCHSNQHNINNCPTIICRYCKEIGHPKWLCKNKDNKDKDREKKNNKKEKKVIEKNINYYLKIEKLNWSNIINNDIVV